MKSAKSQTSSSREIPSLKLQVLWLGGWVRVFFWSLVLLWRLELGIGTFARL
jgi:hypothetical protein